MVSFARMLYASFRESRVRGVLGPLTVHSAMTVWILSANRNLHSLVNLARKMMSASVNWNVTRGPVLLLRKVSTNSAHTILTVTPIWYALTMHAQSGLSHTIANARLKPYAIQVLSVETTCVGESQVVNLTSVPMTMNAKGPLRAEMIPAPGWDHSTMYVKKIRTAKLASRV
jgi:hypothetical protein